MNHKRKNTKGTGRRNDFSGYRASRIKLNDDILKMELQTEKVENKAAVVTDEWELSRPTVEVISEPCESCSA